MGYLTWNKITSFWTDGALSATVKRASQFWKDAWLEEVGPIPPTPEGLDDSGYSGALPPAQTGWSTWEKKKKKKKWIELTCVINGIDFVQKKEAIEDNDVVFGVEKVKISPRDGINESLQVEVQF